MSLAIVSTRYNWMGYHGTESEEAALLRWTGKQSGTLDYNNRQSILQEIEDRLFLVKLDLGLLSAEEIEEMERRRAEAARLEAERLERLRQLHEERLAAERRSLEDEEAIARAELMNQLSEEMNYTAAEQEKYLRAGLSMHTTYEIAVPDFNKAIRAFLVSKDTGFISYLDGSYHMSLEELDQYNLDNREDVARLVASSGTKMPDASRFKTDALHTLVDLKNMYRMKLDAVRCKADGDYINCLRRRERNDDQTPRMDVENDWTEEDLLHKLENTSQELKKARNSYNTHAMSASHPLIVAMTTIDEPYKPVNTARTARSRKGQSYAAESPMQEEYYEEAVQEPEQQTVVQTQQESLKASPEASQQLTVEASNSPNAMEGETHKARVLSPSNVEAEAQNEAQEEKEASHKTLDEKKEEAQEAVDEKKAEAQEAIDEKKAEAQEAIDAKKAEAQEAIDAKKEEAQEAIDAKKAEAQEAIDAKKEEAQEAIDAKKAEAQEAIDEKKEEAKEAARQKEEEQKEALRQKEEEQKEALRQKEEEQKEALRQKEEDAKEAARKKEEELKEAAKNKLKF